MIRKYFAHLRQKWRDTQWLVQDKRITACCWINGKGWEIL